MTVLGPSVTTKWSMTPNNPLCGTYSAKVPVSSNYDIVINGDTLTISAPAVAIVSNYTVAVEVYQDNDSTRQGFVNLNLTVA